MKNNISISTSSEDFVEDENLIRFFEEKLTDRFFQKFFDNKYISYVFKNSSLTKKNYFYLRRCIGFVLFLERFDDKIQL